MKQAILYAAVCALAAAGCAREEPVAQAPLAVLVQTVAGAVGGEVRAYTGEVRARIESPLGFQIGGKLIERSVDVGSVVRKDQVLARLDPVDTRLQADAAHARVAAAEVDLKLAEADWRRAEELHGRNFISASALDARTTGRDAAAARLRQARAEAELAGQQQQYSELRADRDGVVTAVLAEPGQVLGSGDPVVRLAQAGAREVLIHLPENGMQGIVPGAPAQIRPWAAQGTALPGRVREVAPAADQATRTFAVRVALDEAVAAPALGTTATVVFAGAQAGLELPLRALGRQQGAPVVWVVAAGDKVEPRPVEVLGYDEKGVRIAGGVAAGERIVVAGVSELRAGQLVRPVALDAPVALDTQR